MSDVGRRSFTAQEQLSLERLLGESYGYGFLGPVPIQDHVDHATRLAALLEHSGGVVGAAIDLGSGGNRRADEVEMRSWFNPGSL